MSTSQTDDLKAFEYRLQEVIDYMKPATLYWRILLTVVGVSTVIGATIWINDPTTLIVPFIESLTNHPFFLGSCVMLIMLFMTGIHKRIVAPSIMAIRCQQVLRDFYMSCDETGKLILRQRPQ